MTRVVVPVRYPLSEHSRHTLERAIEIAVINLIDNALKYAPESNKVRIWVARKEDKIAIGVADEGPGIEPEDRKRVFERFVRGSGARKRVRGSGIGLALVRHIAEAHGGRVWVESMIPNGSQFIFTLKLDRRRESEQDRSTDLAATS